MATLAAQLAHSPDYPARLAAKARELAAAEKQQPLAAYRAAELAIMKHNFSSPYEPYPQLRRAFVYKHKPTQTPPHLSRQAARFSVIGPETPLDPHGLPLLTWRHRLKGRGRNSRAMRCRGADLCA